MHPMNIATSMYKYQTNMSDHMESALPQSSSSLLWMRENQFSESSLSDQWSNPTQTQGSTITCSSISDIEGAEWPPPAHDLSGNICSASDVNDQLEKLAANLGQEVFASSSTAIAESDQSSAGVLGGALNNINWSSLLSGDQGSTEALQSLERSFFEDALYSRPPNQAGNYLPELGLRKSEDVLSWDFSDKSLGLELESDAVNLVSGVQSQYVLPLLDTDMSWSAMDQSQKHLAGSLSIQDYSTNLPALDFSISNRPHPEYSAKIKQETDVYFSNSSIGNSSLSFQNLGTAEAYTRGGSCMNTNVLAGGQPFRSNSLINLKETGCVHYPVSNNEIIPRKWVTTSSSSRFGPTMLSQLLPGSSSKHGNFHSGSTSRSYLDYNNVRLDHQKNFTSRSDYGCFTDASLGQHAHHEVKLDPHSNVPRRNMGVHNMDEGRELVLDSARSTSSLSTSELTTQTYFKRPRLQQTSNLPFKIVQPRKEKLSERITALQQLVAPFGKTDTASVLTEAIAHIKYMHDQVKLLSKPYPKNTSTPTRHLESAAGRSSWSSDKVKDEESRQDLRNRGLCLVPLSWTSQVVSDNSTEYWTPMHLGGGPR